MKFVLAGESNIGLVRKNNEDNFFLLGSPRRETAFLVVADGIGGHDYGEVASFVCCRDLGMAYTACSDRMLEMPGGGADFLRTHIKAVNRRLFLRNRAEQLMRPMGSTVVALLLLPGRIVYANAGDSRLYRLDRDGNFVQLTRDHTVRICSGKFAECSGSIISMAVGPRPLIHPDIADGESRPGDRFLLCTDGISRYVKDEKLCEFMKHAERPRIAVDSILREALIAGGADNITAVCAFIPPEA